MHWPKQFHPVQVDSAYSSGDVVGALTASRSAWTWNIVGIVSGIVVVINFIIMMPITLELNARHVGTIEECMNTTTNTTHM